MALCKAHKLENAEGVQQLMIDEEMMRDVLVAKEHKELQSFVKTIEIGKAKLNMHRAATADQMKAHFKPKKQRNPKTGGEAQSSKSRSFSRLLPPKSGVTSSATTWLTQNKPAPARPRGGA